MEYPDHLKSLHLNSLHLECSRVVAEFEVVYQVENGDDPLVMREIIRAMEENVSNGSLTENMNSQGVDGQIVFIFFTTDPGMPITCHFWWLLQLCFDDWWLRSLGHCIIRLGNYLRIPTSITFI